MKIKFLNIQLGIFKCFCKLIQDFLYFQLSLCCLPVCFAQSVVLSIYLWILDALLSLGVPESITEGNVGSIPRGIHPAMYSFLIKVLTLKQQCSPVALLGSPASSSWESCSKQEKPASPAASYFIATVQHK